MRYYIIFIIGIIVGIGCQSTPEIDYEDFGPETKIAGLERLPDDKLRLLNGIYEATEGANFAGNKAVGKASRGRFSILLGKGADFSILESGISSDTIIFEGYSRDLINYKSGKVRIWILPSEGSREILNGNIPELVVLRCEFYFSNKPQLVTLKLMKKIVFDSGFLVIAHRGGGRNSDMPPASENSVELIKLSDALGANSVEIDVRATSDNVPILFHDDFISNRLIKGDFLTGPIENYTYSHLQLFGKLKNGEDIPTLNDALYAIIDSTNLKMVWLDIKAPNSLPLIAKQVESFEKYAEQKGRKIEILIGIGSDESYNVFLKEKLYMSVHSLCELSTDKLLKIQSSYWGPSWTLGTQNDAVEELHGKGIKSLVWTIDDRKYMQKYLSEGRFDGFVTNYPSILAFEHYTR